MPGPGLVSGPPSLLSAPAAPDPDANGNGILDGWEIEKFGNAGPGANSSTADPDSPRAASCACACGRWSDRWRGNQPAPVGGRWPLHHTKSPRSLDSYAPSP